MKKILTLQYEGQTETVELHLNRAGLTDLITKLQTLEQGGNQDVHLFTEQWGGTGLTDDPQNREGDLVHHLKIMYWED